MTIFGLQQQQHKPQEADRQQVQNPGRLVREMTIIIVDIRGTSVTFLAVKYVVADNVFVSRPDRHTAKPQVYVVNS